MNEAVTPAIPVTDKVRPGQPKAFKDPALLAAKIADYFQDCEAKLKPPGFYGLAAYLSVHADTLYEYESGKYDTPECKFSDIVKDGRGVILAYAEGRLYDRTAGALVQLVNLTRRSANPYRNPQHVETTGLNGGPIRTDNVLKIEFVDGPGDGKGNLHATVTAGLRSVHDTSGSENPGLEK